MKRALLLVLAAASCAFAQEKGNVIYQTTGAVDAGVSGGFDRASGPVLGAPYSATITNESIQTLADGNRLVQTSTGTTARDSQGRTRQDTVLPPIGNLSAANAPHRSEEHTSELQSPDHLVCRLLLEKKKKKRHNTSTLGLEPSPRNIKTLTKCYQAIALRAGAARRHVRPGWIQHCPDCAATMQRHL